MTHRQGYGWYPAHDEYRGRILGHIRRIKPAFGVVMTEDYAPISEAWEAHPHAICARVWAIDDHNGDAGRALNADPRGAAEDLLQRYVDKIAQWRAQADEAGRPFPDANHLYISAWNEPNQHTSYAKIAEGNQWLCRMATQAGVRVLAIKLGVGHPAELHADKTVDWDDFDDFELEEAINEGGHVVGFHAYFQAEGPNHGEDYAYLAGRHHGWPLDTPMVLDETGIDGGIFNRNDGWGWHAYGVSAAAYADMLRWTHDRLDPRVAAQCPFGLDYQNREWASFNYVDALGYIEQWVADAPTETIHIPVVLNSGDKPHTESAPVTPDDRWERSYAFVRRWEGGLSLDPEDPGNYYQGQLVGTKYGISAAVWGGLYDIPNLTEAQAEAIYRQHYWQASGADRLPWPACLIVFDTAVLHGAGTASAWLRETGGDALAFAARRLKSYVQSDKWHFFGNAWVRREQELLEQAGAHAG